MLWERSDRASRPFTCLLVAIGMAAQAPSALPAPPRATEGAWTARLGDGLRATSLAFSPDGDVLAVAMDSVGLTSDRSASVSLWHLASRRQIGLLPIAGGRAPDLGFSLDGKLLVVATSSGAAVFDVDSRELLRTLDGAPLSNMAVCPRKGAVAFAAAGNVILVLDLATGKELHRRQGTANSIAFSPDCGSLAVAPRGVYLWDLATGETHDSSGGPCATLAFSADGRRLLCRRESSADLTDVATRRSLWGHCCQPGCNPPPTDVALSGDGRLVACASARGLTLWETAARLEPAEQLLRSRQITLPDVKGERLAFSPDGATLAVADQGRLTFLELAAAEQQSEEAVHERAVHICEEAFERSRATRPLESRLAVLANRHGRWERDKRLAERIAPLLRPADPSLLLCVRESLSEKGRYRVVGRPYGPTLPGYRVRWEVRLLRGGDGRVAKGNVEAAPPRTQEQTHPIGPLPVTGDPSDLLVDWVGGQLNEMRRR